MYIMFRMTTPAFNYIGEMCLAFSYHMRGDDIGTLGVYIQTGDVYTSAVRSVFTRTGQQGSASEAWLSTRVTVQTNNNLDRVRIVHQLTSEYYALYFCLTIPLTKWTTLRMFLQYIV